MYIRIYTCITYLFICIFIRVFALSHPCVLCSFIHLISFYLLSFPPSSTRASACPSGERTAARENPQRSASVTNVNKWDAPPHSSMNFPPNPRVAVVLQGN